GERSVSELSVGRDLQAAVVPGEEHDGRARVVGRDEEEPFGDAGSGRHVDNLIRSPCGSLGQDEKDSHDEERYALSHALVSVSWDSRFGPPRNPPPRSSSFDTQRFDQFQKVLRLEAEPLSRCRPIPVRRGERVHNHLSPGRLDCAPVRACSGSGWRCPGTDAARQILDGYAPARAQDHCALDDVAQLTYIPWPVILLEPLPGLTRDLGDIPPHGAGVLL